jgi:hypothetical protein
MIHPRTFIHWRRWTLCCELEGRHIQTADARLSLHWGYRKIQHREKFVNANVNERWAIELTACGKNISRLVKDQSSKVDKCPGLTDKFASMAGCQARLGLCRWYLQSVEGNKFFYTFFASLTRNPSINCSLPFLFSFSFSFIGNRSPIRRVLTEKEGKLSDLTQASSRVERGKGARAAREIHGLEIL